MTPIRVAGAIGAGLLLATLPWWPFIPLVAPQAHADHAPRHGGQLGMAGDHHVELVRRRGRVEAFVSDARRRPVRPSEGWVAFDRSPSVPLVWEGHRLVGADRPDASELEAVMILYDGTRLAIGFDLGG